MNNRRNYIFAQKARWFTSQLPDSDAIAYKTKVLAAGGIIVDFTRVNEIFKTLKKHGLLANCQYLVGADLGIKKDAVNNTSVLFNIGWQSATAEATQLTGSAQPQWTDEGGVPRLVFSGSKSMGLGGGYYSGIATFCAKYRSTSTTANGSILTSTYPIDSLRIKHSANTNPNSWGAGLRGVQAEISQTDGEINSIYATYRNNTAEKLRVYGNNLFPVGADDSWNGTTNGSRGLQIGVNLTGEIFRVAVWSGYRMSQTELGVLIALGF